MDSFHELHRRYVHPVLTRLRGRLGPLLRRTYETDDLVQSLFLDILADLPRFEDRGPKAFRNWLLVRARNKLGMKRRRKLDARGRRREIALEDRPGDAAGPLTVASTADDLARLRRLLADAEPWQREILHLRGREGLSHVEIAYRLGIRPDAARMRYARALLDVQAKWNRA